MQQALVGAIFYLFEQHFQGDEGVLGNVVIHRTQSFRLAVNRAREVAKQLRERGCECKAIDQLKGRLDAFGYRVIEPPNGPGGGRQWNLLVIRREAGQDYSDQGKELPA